MGWDETKDQYKLGNGPINGRNVTLIVEQVVTALAQDPRRTFQAVEMAYWIEIYEAFPPALQQLFVQAVRNRQLIFLNAGWSMGDEASPSYVDMLDNQYVGAHNVRDYFGAQYLPTATWQIDPFGHSATQGLFSSPLAGVKGVMWAREAADYKALSYARQTQERLWTPSPSLGAAKATAFAGIFSSYGYGTPSGVTRCNGTPSPPSTSCNGTWGAVDVWQFYNDIVYNIAPGIRGNDVLALFGTDFQHENAVDYLAYIDSLRDALNQLNAQGVFPNITATYSSPAAYMTAKIASGTLPAFEGDFFPYNDDTQGHNMWAGYFTSRPAYKGLVRETSALHQAARQLQVLAGGAPQGLGPSNPLYKLERAIGVAQHHDSVSGTAKQVVDFDYTLILEGGRQAAYAGVAAFLANLTGYASAPFSVCPLANVSICPPLEAGSPAVVVAHNALAQDDPAAPVRVAVGMPTGVASWAVFDAAGAPVTAQLVPLSDRDVALRALYNGSASVAVSWLYFQGRLPAAGFSSFFLVPASSAADAPRTHASEVRALASSASSASASAGAAGDDVSFGNGRLVLTVNQTTGFLSRYQDTLLGVDIPLAQSWMWYAGCDGNSSCNGSNQASGAYIFRPKTPEPSPVVPGGAAAAVTLVTGPVVNETQHVYGYITQSTRLWAGAANAEIEWTVGPVNVTDKQSHEVVVRYSSGLPTGGQWTTDSNCREGQARRRNFRPQWNVTIVEPVSGNYFPTNCLIRTSGGGVTMAVAVDRSEGGTSLNDGELELMVHRRMLYDDKRGVAEALNEPGIDGKGLIVRGRHWLVAAPAAAAAPLYRRLQELAVAQPRALTAFAGLGSYSVAQWLSSFKPTAALLASPLPPNVHLVAAHAQGNGTVLVRLAHVYEANEDPSGSQPATVALATLFSGLPIVAAEEMTVIGTQPLAGIETTTYSFDDGRVVTLPALPAAPSGPGLEVTLEPMDIRTFLCTIG